MLSQAFQKIFATYRSAEIAKEFLDLAANNPQILSLILADSILNEDLCNVEQIVIQEMNKLDFVINCVGYLRNADHGPEKNV